MSTEVNLTFLVVLAIAIMLFIAMLSESITF